MTNVRTPEARAPGGSRGFGSNPFADSPATPNESKARTLGSKGYTVETRQNFGPNPFADSPVTPDESHRARSPGSKGYTIDTRPGFGPNPFVDSPVTPDESHADLLVAKTTTTTTPSFSSSAFRPVTPPRIRRKAPVSPPKIQRKARVNKDAGAAFSTPRPRAKGKDTGAAFFTPKPKPKGDGKEDKDERSPCDTTQEASLPESQGTPPTMTVRDDVPRRKGGKGEKGGWKTGVAGASLKVRIERMKRSLPKNKARAAAAGGQRGKKTKKKKEDEGPIDLADLAVAAIGVVPRHGAGIASGRSPLERTRTSLALHMVRECENRPPPPRARGSGVRSSDGVAGLDGRLRGCVADEGTDLAEKSQEVVRLAKDALEELDDGGRSLAKTELGQRNLTCLKFLSGMYREVISDEKRIDSRDALSLMVVAGAYYALGKFDPALSVYQRAGIELRKRIATSPAQKVHCAKLFNNMGCVYFEMGRHEKAMQTFQRALQLFHDDGDRDDRAAWTAAILDQACIMNNMAYVLIKFKQYDDASDLVDASFELQQILPTGGKANASMTISSLSTMAFVYYRTKQYRRSLDTYTACVQLQDRSPLCGERDQVELLRKMADICRKIRDHEKRVYLLRTMLVYQQCYLLEDDDEIWDTHAALAETLQAFADSGGTSI